MFKRNTTPTETQQPVQAVERITSVLGSGVIWHGSINGSGGVRIEGAFEGDITLRGLIVIGETGWPSRGAPRGDPRDQLATLGTP